MFVAGALLAGAPEAEGEDDRLSAVLARTAAYVAEFRQRLSGLVAEETYTQDIRDVGRLTGSPRPHQSRTLASDLLLVRPADGDRYVELRDVFAVDGQAIRERQSRLEDLVKQSTDAAGRQIRDIIATSARYNIGSVVRNINTPLMPLQFLDRANQSRFRFKHVARPSPVFQNASPQAPDTPVFRVSVEMWNVEYEERQKHTIIRTTSGDDLPAKGRFWINPATGAVLISELILHGEGVQSMVTVSYQSEPVLGFLVPVEMRETYLRGGERITGQATYGQFRPLH